MITLGILHQKRKEKKEDPEYDERERQTKGQKARHKRIVFMRESVDQRVTASKRSEKKRKRKMPRSEVALLPGDNDANEGRCYETLWEYKLWGVTDLY